MSMTVNHPAARKLYGFKLQKNSLYSTFFYKNKFIQPAENSEKGCIVEMNELKAPQANGKASGYQITYDLDGNITGITIAGDNTVEGTEGDLNLYTDIVQINDATKGVRSKGKFADQLIPHSFRDRAEREFKQYWAIWYDEQMIAKMSGALGQGTWFTLDPTKPTTSGRDINGSVAFDGNDLRAPSTNRIIYGNGKAAQANLATTDILSFDMLDLALMQAIRPEANTTTGRILKPLDIDGMPTLVLLTDVLSMKDMASTVTGRFYDLEKAKIQGGTSSQLYKGAAKIYETAYGINVLIYTHPKMVKFSAAATGSVKASRSLLMGQQAGVVAYGRESKNAPNYDWHEETDNRGKRLVIDTTVTTGVQKCAFTTTEEGATREDFGVIALDSYANW